MSRVFGVVVMVAVLSLSAMAADTPRAEAFGGFQYFRANSGIDVPGFDNFNLNGWDASVTGYFNRFVGVTADFSGAYGTPDVLGIPVNTKLHTFMVGPVIRLSNPTHITPFVHALGGGARISGDVFGIGDSETDAAWAVGGGLDLDFAPMLSLRPVQVDFLQTRFGGEKQNNFRYSAGIVLKF